MSQSKSRHLGVLGHDEKMRVNPRTGTIQKSNIKISSEMHDAALSGGAREILMRRRQDVHVRQRGRSKRPSRYQF
jgi:hypothetical protein